MGRLDDDLREMHYEPTSEESPFSEDAALWSNGCELVCSDTGTVIDSTWVPEERPSTSNGEKRYHKYPNSGIIRMPGGYFGQYDWGEDEDGDFNY